MRCTSILPQGVSHEHMHSYTHACTHMHACLHTYMLTDTYTCLQAPALLLGAYMYTDIHARLNFYAYSGIHMFTPLCTHECSHKCMCVHMHSHTCLHSYTQPHPNACLYMLILLTGEIYCKRTRCCSVMCCLVLPESRVPHRWVSHSQALNIFMSTHAPFRACVGCGREGIRRGKGSLLHSKGWTTQAESTEHGMMGFVVSTKSYPCHPLVICGRWK